LTLRAAIRDARHCRGYTNYQGLGGRMPIMFGWVKEAGFDNQE
jgi:hypothetical protein